MLWNENPLIYSNCVYIKKTKNKDKTKSLLFSRFLTFKIADIWTFLPASDTFQEKGDLPRRGGILPQPGDIPVGPHLGAQQYAVEGEVLHGAKAGSSYLYSSCIIKIDGLATIACKVTL